MSGFDTQAEKNATLNWKLARWTHVSLHTANPGATGANEATGGSPAYARIPITWNAASGGAATAATLPTFDVPAGTYSYLGFHTALTGGTFMHKESIASQTFAGQDVCPIGSITIDYNATADA